VDELEATAPSIPQHYSDQVALAVRAALTDAELFISYNMPTKALGPLTAALPQAPNDLRLNQRLAALHTRAGRAAEAAICCRTLQNVYSEAGYPDEATRYGELAGRYEGRSGSPAATDSITEEAAQPADVASEEVSLAGASSPWPGVVAARAVEGAPSGEELEFAIVEEQPTTESDTAPAEIDLSSEWDDTITIDADTAAAEAVEIGISDAVGDHDVPDGKVDETIEEIHFYVEHGMPEQAAATLVRLQTLTHDEAKLASIRAEVEAAVQHTAAAEEVEPEPVAEFTSEGPVAETAIEEAESAPVAGEQATPVHAEKSHAPAELKAERSVPQPGPAALKDFVADLESSLGDSFLPGTVRHDAGPAPARAAKPRPEVAREFEPAAHVEPAVTSEQRSQDLGGFVADLETSLGDDFLKRAPVAKAEPVSAAASAESSMPIPVAAPHISVPLAASAAAAAGTVAPSPHVPARPVMPVAEAPKPQTSPVLPSAPPAAGAKSSPFGEEAGVDLAEMFGELKHDLESDVASADEDPETHYNLGIAFREMGLLDEAIGELQKTCQAVDRGHSFPQVMQTYTWLAQCFLEKGVPEASIRWYHKALAVPTIDEDTRTALHYELAAAYETAGDKPSAFKHFMEVYGRNIDHRDVAERIKAMKS
jgi:hypothetical protein